jgi:hypothetical protein
VDRDLRARWVTLGAKRPIVLEMDASGVLIYPCRPEVGIHQRNRLNSRYRCWLFPGNGAGPSKFPDCALKVRRGFGLVEGSELHPAMLKMMSAARTRSGRSVFILRIEWMEQLRLNPAATHVHSHTSGHGVFAAMQRLGCITSARANASQLQTVLL